MELRRGLEKALHSDRVLEDNRCFVDKRAETLHPAFFFLFIETELAHVVILSSHIRKVGGSRIVSPTVAFQNCLSHYLVIIVDSWKNSYSLDQNKWKSE